MVYDNCRNYHDRAMGVLHFRGVSTRVAERTAEDSFPACLGMYIGNPTDPEWSWCLAIVVRDKRSPDTHGS